jgi:hypothetical protein
MRQRPYKGLVRAPRLYVLLRGLTAISEAIPRWQVWRCFRGPRTLANWFSQTHCNVEASGNSLLTKHQEKVIGRGLIGQME